MDMRINKRAVLLTLAVAVVVTACGDKGRSPQSAKPTPPDDQQIEKVEACYLGSQRNRKICYRLQDLDAAKVGYLDPYTDSSFHPNWNKSQYQRPVRAINLSNVDAGTLLTPNFKFIEFMRPADSDFGIYSTAVLEIMQKIREKINLPIKINSGFRSPEHNMGIDGAARWSRHQYGDAVDFFADGVSLAQLERLCLNMGATYTDTYARHVHCDWRAKKLDAGFYGASASASEDLMSELNTRSALIYDLNKNSEIIIQGRVLRGQIIRLSSSVPYKEDTEELYKKWTISMPDGQKQALEEPVVFISLKKGRYEIEHKIGSHILLYKTILVR